MSWSRDSSMAESACGVRSGDERWPSQWLVTSTSWLWPPQHPAGSSTALLASNLTPFWGRLRVSSVVLQGSGYAREPYDSPLGAVSCSFHCHGFLGQAEKGDLALPKQLQVPVPPTPLHAWEKETNCSPVRAQEFSLPAVCHPTAPTPSEDALPEALPTVRACASLAVRERGWRMRKSSSHPGAKAVW